MRKIFFILFLLCNFFLQAQEYFLLVGTYTSGKSEGIYVYRFNTKTGDAEHVYTAKGISNPSYLAIASSGKYVYSVNENGGKSPAQISSFAFNQKNGTLTFLNSQLSGGDGPCYVSVHPSGKWVIAGNYSGGSLAAFPVSAHGSLQPYSQSIQHTGKSANEMRQEKAHVHATVFSPDNKFVLVPDLGMDKIMNYRFNMKSVKPLSAATIPFIKTEPGSGPRHLEFHPNQKYMYLIEELTGMVVGYKYEGGKYSLLQQISSHPDDFTGVKGSADIHVSPDGKFLYASNRGDANNIAIFSIDKKTGKLKTMGFQSTLGKTPRNFMIDPSGNYLLVANQQSDNIVIFKIDPGTGLLTETGNQIEVPNPVCLKMIKAN